MKRSEILEAARRCVCGEREQDFGITAKDAGTMLALLKVARIATGSSPDSFIDLAGYAACAGEIVTERSYPYEKAETQTQE